MKNIRLALWIVLGALVSSLYACGGDDQNAPAVCGYVSPPNNKIKKVSPNDGIDWGAQGGHPPTSQNVTQTSSLGITVYSESGVSAAQLDRADAAYTYEAERARTEGGYTNIPAASTFKIYVPTSCGLSPIQRTPAFKVKASADWDTNEFDVHHTYVYKIPEQDWQDGPPCRLLRTRYSEGDGRAVIWAAEQLMAANTIEGQKLAVCDSEIFEEAVKNGVQHVLIMWNNWPYFEATLFAQHAHPLRYEPPAQAVRGESHEFDDDGTKQLKAIAVK